MRTRIVGLLVVSFLVAGCEKSRLDARVRELCSRDGGIKVFETVALPLNRFDKWGNFPLPAREYAKPSDEYFYVLETEYLKTGKPDLLRTRMTVVRRADGKVLGESIRYTRRGGDMPGPWHESSFGCPDLAAHRSLEKSVFVRSAVQ